MTMTHEERLAKVAATFARVKENGEAFAIKWHDAKLAEQEGRLGADNCSRCEGTGLITWFGHLGSGGRQGPCVKCKPLRAAQFAQEHARETWEGRRFAQQQENKDGL